VSGDRDAGLEHLLAVVPAQIVVDDEHLVEMRSTEAHRQIGAPRELLRPPHRPCPDVERVEVHVAEAQQRRSEHVALSAALFRDQPVLSQRLDDPVHGRRRQAQCESEIGDAEVARTLQQLEHLGGAIDGLDHGASSLRFVVEPGRHVVCPSRS